MHPQHRAAGDAGGLRQAHQLGSACVTGVDNDPLPASCSSTSAEPVLPSLSCGPVGDLFHPFEGFLALTSCFEGRSYLLQARVWLLGSGITISAPSITTHPQSFELAVMRGKLRGGALSGRRGYRD